MIRSQKTSSDTLDALMNIARLTKTDSGPPSPRDGINNFTVSSARQTSMIQTKIIDKAVQAEAQRKDAKIKKAIWEGYDGVDFLSNGEVIFWNDEPPSKGPGVRYDLRYYSHDTLEHLAEHGRFPNE